MFCRKCGNQMPDFAVFCDKCGTRSDNIVNHQYSQPVANSDTKFNYSLIGMIVSFLIVPINFILSVCCVESKRIVSWSSPSGYTNINVISSTGQTIGWFLTVLFVAIALIFLIMSKVKYPKDFTATFVVGIIVVSLSVLLSFAILGNS